MPAASAIVPGTVDAVAIPLPKDHICIVKFNSVDDLAFKMVLHHISSVMQSAIPKVASNWEKEINIRSQLSTISMDPGD